MWVVFSTTTKILAPASKTNAEKINFALNLIVNFRSTFNKINKAAKILHKRYDYAEEFLAKFEKDSALTNSTRRIMREFNSLKAFNPLMRYNKIKKYNFISTSAPAKIIAIFPIIFIQFRIFSHHLIFQFHKSEKASRQKDFYWISTRKARNPVAVLWRVVLSLEIIWNSGNQNQNSKFKK